MGFVETEISSSFHTNTDYFLFVFIETIKAEFSSRVDNLFQFTLFKQFTRKLKKHFEKCVLDHYKTL